MKNKISNQLIEIKAIFEDTYYGKYDIFKAGGVEFLCLDNPKGLDDGTYEINVIPKCFSEKELNTIFVGNLKSEY